jgi:hypothetical protein
MCETSSWQLHFTSAVGVAIGGIVNFQFIDPMTKFLLAVNLFAFSLYVAVVLYVTIADNLPRNR